LPSSGAVFPADVPIICTQIAALITSAFIAVPFCFICGSLHAGYIFRDVQALFLSPNSVKVMRPDIITTLITSLWHLFIIRSCYSVHQTGHSVCQVCAYVTICCRFDGTDSGEGMGSLQVSSSYCYRKVVCSDMLKNAPIFPLPVIKTSVTKELAEVDLIEVRSSISLPFFLCTLASLLSFEPFINDLQSEIMISVLHDLHVPFWVNIRVYVGNIFCSKAPYHVGNSVHISNMGEKPVAKAFTLVGILDEAGNVDEFDGCMRDLFRFKDF